MKLEVTADEQIAVEQIKRSQTMRLAEKQAALRDLAWVDGDLAIRAAQKPPDG